MIKINLKSILYFLREILFKINIFLELIELQKKTIREMSAAAGFQRHWHRSLRIQSDANAFGIPATAASLKTINLTWS